ncbi:MAG: OmpA family protein [Spirochaetaceae bacterium]|jgi:outer membrane protein OmpA-like peptidoglycan-associated protein|nr:OmpA family protein [Spirochaetaceae bacterium]
MSNTNNAPEILYAQIVPRVFVLAAMFLFCPALFADKFEFKHREGDKFRLLSSAEEEVLLNGKTIQRSKILNRMAQEVRVVNEGQARIDAVFNVAQETLSAENEPRYSWGEEYSSEFIRNKLGKITIDKKYFMPTARDLPLFPEREIKTGESWISRGNEVFDLRRNFEIKEPYSVPFNATNTFIGERQWKNKKYKAIQIQYSLYKNNDGFENEPHTYILPRNQKPNSLPESKPSIKRITGKSEQIIYWDEAIGQIAAAEDKYELNFELSNGEKWTFRGTAVAEILEAQTMDKKEALRDVTEAIKALKLEDVRVEAVEEGISISMDNIQFAPDSAELLASEKQKLNKIAEILRRYNERDILVSGHTAQAGANEAARIKLSEERAVSVADYFIKEKVRAPARIITRGYGSSRPAASNLTEEGRKKNRRVEITILEN